MRTTQHHTFIPAFLALVLLACNGGNGKKDAADESVDEEAEEVVEDADAEEAAEDVPGDPDADEGEDAADAAEEDAPARPSRIVILHTNDEHSHLLATGPRVDDWPPAEDAGDGTLKGNVYRRAVLLNRERAAASEEGLPTLTLSAGDFSMGTLFHLGSVTDGIDFKLMKLMSYDVATLGNHEFDFGCSTVATMLEHGGLMEGVPLSIPILSSNIHFSSSTGDDALEDLYAYDGSGGALLKGYYVKTLPDGTRVGFIGLLGLDAALVAAFKSPLNFSLAFTDQECSESWECPGGASCIEGYCTAGSIQDHEAHMPALVADTADAVRIVRAEGVDLVVALSHVGVDEREVEAILAGTLDPLESETSEELVLAREVDRTLAAEGMSGIDVIIGGHSHTAIEAPIAVPDPTGGDHRTIVVQAGAYGKYLGRLEIHREDAGLPWQVDADGSRLIEINDGIPVSELPPVAKDLIDQVIEGTMEGVEGAVVEQAVNVFNPGDLIVDDIDILGDLFFYTLAESAFDVEGEMPHRETPLMHLVTDAAREMLNQAVFTSDPVVAYVQANGVIRDSLLVSRVDGALSLADTFAVLPLGVSPIEETPGFPVIDFYMSAAELKTGLEVGLSMGFLGDSFFLGYSGVKVEYDPNLPPFDTDDPTGTGRVTKMTLWDPAADSGLAPWEDGYSDVIFDIAASPDPFSGRSEEIVHVATNLYLGLFIEGFGLCPRDSSGQWDPLCGLCANDDADCEDGLGNTAHCLDDAVETGIGRCTGGSIPSVIKYITHFPGDGPEVKEWITLVGYLQNLSDESGNEVPDVPVAYDPGDPSIDFPSRICCVQSPASETDPCCRTEPCDNNYIPCP